MKKVLALVMALALVFSLGVSALAADTSHDTHATKPVESDAASGSVVGKMGESTDVSTDVYLLVAADDDEPPEVKVKVIAIGEDGQLFVVDYTDKSKTTFAATVPLYVCLYGYGQSGGVATPTDYKIENSSWHIKDRKINELDQYYPVYTSVVELLSALGGKDALAPGDTDDADFKSIHSGDTDRKTTGGQSYKDIADLIPADGAAALYYFRKGQVKRVASGTDSVKLAGQGDTQFVLVPLGANEKVTFWIGEKTDANKYDNKQKGDYLDSQGTAAPPKQALALVISEISATTYGWKLTESVPTGAKELLLSINNLNIAGAVDSPLLLGTDDWKIPAPTISGDTVTAESLELKLQAAIAANANKNEEAAVVNVAYTLAAAG